MVQVVVKNSTKYVTQTGWASTVEDKKGRDGFESG